MDMTKNNFIRIPKHSCRMMILALMIFQLCTISYWQRLKLEGKGKGKVLELDESSFEAAISTFDYILVDFYAPWCPHSQRLAPELDKAAPMLSGLKDPIVIAKVNALENARLSRKYEIIGYPTLKIFMHGVPTGYYGPREAEFLVPSLRKLIGPDVTVLESDSAIRDFIEAAGTFYHLFLGFGLNESTVLNSAIKYKEVAWFAVAKDPSESTMALYHLDKKPAFVYLRPSSNLQAISYCSFEEKFLDAYIKQSLFPQVWPITKHTLRLLKDDGREIVVTIIEDEEHHASKTLVKRLKATVSANPDLVFAYVGIKQWQDFAELFEVDKKTQLPKMVVWDGNDRYFLVAGSENITESEGDPEVRIKQIIKGYRQGSVIEKHIGNPSLIGYINSLISSISPAMLPPNQIISLGAQK